MIFNRRSRRRRRRRRRAMVSFFVVAIKRSIGRLTVISTTGAAFRTARTGWRRDVLAHDGAKRRLGKDDALFPSRRASRDAKKREREWTVYARVHGVCAGRARGGDYV